MYRRLPWLTMALLFLAAPARPELDIQVRGMFVDIRAQRVSLHQVLDTLSQKTGMAIVYDTEPPQDTVSIELRDINVRTAVTELLRGHGLTYALVMDPTGLRVNKLLLTNGGGGAVRAAPARQQPQMPQQEAYEQQEYYEEPEPPEPPPPAEQPQQPQHPQQAPPPAGMTWPGQGGIPGIPTFGGSSAPPSIPGFIQQVPPSSEPPPPPPEGQPQG